MEAPIVVMDDDFMEAYSKVFAEKAAPVYQQMLNEKYQAMKTYTYLAVWNGILLGSAGTMILAKLIMGAY
jgi:hypothetical protein|tara:strand:- start:580 stop:789 length:210 start_codon:yes stop_codon:yes gene_type:complete